MADDLRFGIVFDLEKGVRAVIAKDDTYLRQIEHAMSREPIVLRAEADASKLHMFSRQLANNIDDISTRLATVMNGTYLAAQKNAAAQNKLKIGFISLGKSMGSGLGFWHCDNACCQLCIQYFGD